MNDHDIRFSRRQLAVALTMAAGVGCRSDPDSAQGVAERFVDQHYVRIDLASAEPLCTGVAQAKVRESMRLTAGVQIDAATRKPIVHYRIQPHGAAGDEASFVFDATIQVDGAESFSRRWLVLVQRRDGAWKVANFSEEAGVSE